MCLRMLCVHELCVHEKVLCVLCVSECVGVNVVCIEALGVHCLVRLPVCSVCAAK